MKNKFTKIDMALLVFCLILLFSVKTVLGQSVPTKTTKFIPTNQQFKNGELVYSVEYMGNPVGEFWPIYGMNLVTRQTDSFYFAPGTGIADIQSALRGIATAPDGMTTGSQGMYQMEGKALSNGRPCGDGVARDYGIMVVDRGFAITFTHAREHNNTDSLYDAVRARKGTLFYLPSIYRNGRALNSSTQVDKVLIRRTVPKTTANPTGEQIGVIIFNRMVTYTEAIKMITGLDRTEQGAVVSQTTHIYVLDGGPSWGQSCKEVNGQVQLVGTRNTTVVTNYLVFY